MGIDYVVARDCPPRDALGSDGIVQLHKARDRAEMVLEQFRSQGDTRSASEITFQVMLRTPEGDDVKEVRVQDLLDQAKALDEHRGHCKDCPVDRGGKGYGCTRYIRYPIPAAAERWLLSRLPDDLDSTAGTFLVAAMEDFDWSGEQAASMRAEGDTYFESDEAAQVSWGGGEEDEDEGEAEGDDDEDGGAITIDADQVFHMLFHVGHIQPTHATMLCLFFGLLPHDLDVEVLRDPERRAQALIAARTQADPDEDLGGIDEFLESLALAAAHGYNVLIDG